LLDRFGVIPKPTVTVRMGEGLAKARITIPCRSKRHGGQSLILETIRVALLVSPSKPPR